MKNRRQDKEESFTMDGVRKSATSCVLTHKIQSPLPSPSPKVLSLSLSLSTACIVEKGKRTSKKGPFSANIIVLLMVTLPTLLLSVYGANVDAEKRLSNRIVTTKYGALRGQLVTLPNRSLQPVESFLGKY